MLISCLNNGDKGYFLTRIYAIGKLEEQIKYDLIKTTNELFFESLHLIQKEKTIHTVMLHEGKELPVVMILWREELHNGLIGCVVLEDDEEGIKEAKIKQKRKDLYI